VAAVPRGGTNPSWPAEGERGGERSVMVVELGLELGRWLEAVEDGQVADGTLCALRPAHCALRAACCSLLARPAAAVWA
jgi:hypothetical protein